MPLQSATLRARLDLLQSGANAFAADRNAPVIEALMSFLVGTGAGQADLFYAAQRPVTSGANDDLDLAGGLADAFGATLTFVEIAALLIINAPISGAANTTNLTLGVGSNPVVGYLGGTTPTLGPIRPGGVRLLAETDAAGLCAVTAGTGDILRVANSAGATANYQIAILGRSA